MIDENNRIDHTLKVTKLKKHSDQELIDELKSRGYLILGYIDKDEYLKGIM